MSIRHEEVITDYAIVDVVDTVFRCIFSNPAVILGCTIVAVGINTVVIYVKHALRKDAYALHATFFLVVFLGIGCCYRFDRRGLVRCVQTCMYKIAIKRCA